MNIDDFNTISFSEMVKLPGVGRTTANRIVLYRSKRPISNAKDLLRIKGIGNNTLKKLGIDVPSRKKKITREQKMADLCQYISGFTLSQKTPFEELPYNKKIEFYEDLVKDTCHRPDLVKSVGCESCPYALLCKCYLRNFVSERNKRKALPTKKVLKNMLDNIGRYFYYKQTNDEINFSKLNIPAYD